MLLYTDFFQELKMEKWNPLHTGDITSKELNKELRKSLERGDIYPRRCKTIVNRVIFVLGNYGGRRLWWKRHEWHDLNEETSHDYLPALAVKSHPFKKAKLLLKLYSIYFSIDESYMEVVTVKRRAVCADHSSLGSTEPWSSELSCSDFSFGAAESPDFSIVGKLWPSVWRLPPGQLLESACFSS